MGYPSRSPRSAGGRVIAHGTVWRGAHGIPPSQMLRTGVFWWAWSACLLALRVGLGLMGHLVVFATESSVEPMSVAVLLSIVVIFNGTGRTGSGALTDAIGHNRVPGGGFAARSYPRRIDDGLCEFRGPLGYVLALWAWLSIVCSFSTR